MRKLVALLPGELILLPVSTHYGRAHIVRTAHGLRMSLRRSNPDRPGAFMPQVAIEVTHPHSPSYGRYVTGGVAIDLKGGSYMPKGSWK